MISQTVRMLKILGVECFSRQMFHKHPKNYLQKNLIPVVIKLWKEEQDKVIQSVSSLEGGLVLLGDGRSDSPGHCANYGAFTVIEQRVNKVLDVQFVQVSGSMEPVTHLAFFLTSVIIFLLFVLCLIKCKIVPGGRMKVCYIWRDFWLIRIFS